MRIDAFSVNPLVLHSGPDILNGDRDIDYLMGGGGSNTLNGGRK